MRTTHTFQISNTEEFKKKLLNWSKNYNETIFLDSNSYEDPYSSYDLLVAVDAYTKLSANLDSFNKLDTYYKKTSDWLFGYFSYDLKNDLENLESNNYDALSFSKLYFFQHKKVITLKGKTVHFLYLNAFSNEAEVDFKIISNSILSLAKKSHRTNIKIKLRIHKEAYFKKVNALLKHIRLGDIYEANFCQEFYADNVKIDPIISYLGLNEISKAPFATFLKIKDKYLLSASPERYIKKIGAKVLSQPIKGTAARSKDKKEDATLKKELALDVKERAENIMITDLVRNDLSKFATKGSVKVEELCKVYSFEQVFQMISTISAEVKNDENPIEIIKATFPMGSMTGAPKISALQLIEEFEETKRGLYSGAVGYFTPDGDFDFNVVIRSILYNETKEYVSYIVGSAITAGSKPEKEYQECLLKAKAMRTILESN